MGRNRTPEEAKAYRIKNKVRINEQRVAAYQRNKAKIAKAAAADRLANPDKYKQCRRRHYLVAKDKVCAGNLRRRTAAQDATRPNATQHAQFWDIVDEVLLLTSKLTNKELALQLGRTYISVTKKRARLKRDTIQ